jgi:hypothetical protein
VFHMWNTTPGSGGSTCVCEHLAQEVFHMWKHLVLMRSKSKIDQIWGEIWISMKLIFCHTYFNLWNSLLASIPSILRLLLHLLVGTGFYLTGMWDLNRSGSKSCSVKITRMGLVKRFYLSSIVWAIGVGNSNMYLLDIII